MVSKKGSRSTGAGAKRGVKSLAAKNLKAGTAGTVRGGGKKKGDGTRGGTVTGGWDLTRNKINA